MEDFWCEQISIRLLEIQNRGPYRLSSTNILQSLNIQHFLAQLSLAATLRVVLDSREIGRALEKFGQRLRRHMIVFVISIHIIVGIGVIPSALLLFVRVCPIRHRM